MLQQENWLANAKGFERKARVVTPTKIDIYDVGWPRRSQTRCREAKPLLDKLLLFPFIESAVLGSWTAEANGKPILAVQLRMRFPSLEDWIYALAFVKFCDTLLA